MVMKPAKFTLTLAVALLSIIGAAAINPALAGTYMATGAPAVPPAGFIGFCVKHLQDCIAKPQEAAVVELTDAKRRALEAVQYNINTSIRPREDATHAWEYPTDGTGDCNKYALSKRRDLIAQGWPRDTLLLATAVTERGEGHLVLVVHTDKGDLVLDNRLPQVVDWSTLPYHWVSVQTQQSPVRWVSVLSRPIATADAGPVLRSPAPAVVASARAPSIVASAGAPTTLSR
jgi:predicted transglutaminase-like cysteine proteinase